MDAVSRPLGEVELQPADWVEASSNLWRNARPIDVAVTAEGKPALFKIKGDGPWSPKEPPIGMLKFSYTTAGPGMIFHFNKGDIDIYLGMAS